MSRRIGQKGSVFQRDSGAWNPKKTAFGRYYIDAGQNRIRKKIALGLCATKTIAGQKLREYLEREGVNSPILFRQNTGPSVTFREQAEVWRARMRARRRKRVHQATLDNWDAALDRWLLPLIGGMQLADVNNAALKMVIEKMYEANPKYGPSTIKFYTQPLKMVVASAVTSEGEEIYPRKWNHEFVGMPIIDPTKQRRPTMTSAQLEVRLAKLAKREWLIAVLLAGSGLRRGEVLALKVEDFSADCRVLQVERSVYNRYEQSPKSPAAFRPVDLAPELAEIMFQYLAGKSGLLFTTAEGRPLIFRNVARSFQKAGFEGFHSFRRFRTERLVTNGCPEPLKRLWLGHADRMVTDLYERGVANNASWRQEWTQRIGLGFSIGPQWATK